MDNLSHEQKLRVTIYIEVRKICLEAANKTNKNLDKEALDLIAELVWKKLRTLSQDLEHFAKHSKRTTVTTEDVKLSLRRLPTLRTYITRLSEEQGKRKHPSTSSARDDTNEADPTRHPSTSSAREDTNEADPTRHPSTSPAQDRPNEEETTNEVFES